MEYIQLTLDDYIQAKEEIKKDLGGIVKGFVRVGWLLTRIDKSQAYKRDGYNSIAEFARSEYGMNPSGVSRFMEVYERYSLEGDTPELKEQYREFNFSQLTEMLALTDEEQEIFRPEAKRESIREYKAFRKENEEDPEKLFNWMRDPEDSLKRAVLEFYKENPTVMDELFGGRCGITASKDAVEAVNPSGNGHFRFKTTFLMFYGYDRGIMVAEFGQSPSSMTWKEFFDITEELFEGLEEGPGAWERAFGVKTEPEEEQIPGQDSITNHPELMPADSNPPQENAKEEPQAAVVPEEIGPERGIAPAQRKEQTEEEKYDAEQRRIDRETKQKLQEMEDREKMEHLPGDNGPVTHTVRLPSAHYDDVASGRKPFELRKNLREQGRGYQAGHVLQMLEYSEGRYTGREIHAEVTYVLEDYAGLEEGYAILGIRVMDFI